MMWLVCSSKRGTAAGPRETFTFPLYEHTQWSDSSFADLNRELLEELVSISETFVEGEGQGARALFKLSQLYDETGRAAESKYCRERAVALRDKVNPDLQGAPVEESEFSKLCPWMLW